MKKLLLFSLILIGCAKKSPEPQQTQNITPTPVASKYVEIFITYGTVNNFASVKWSYDPNVDSSYTSNNSLSRTIRNYTNSDSILVYTNSGAFSNNTVQVFVNGIIKDSYTGIQTAKVIKLN